MEEAVKNLATDWTKRKRLVRYLSARPRMQVIFKWQGQQEEKPDGRPD